MRTRSVGVFLRQQTRLLRTMITPQKRAHGYSLFSQIAWHDRPHAWKIRRLQYGYKGKHLIATVSRRVDKYRSIKILCARCNYLLFRYKKKNGTKSALIKILINRIAEDPNNMIPENVDELPSPCECPKCGEAFARPAVTRGSKCALKIIGNRVHIKG